LYSSVIISINGFNIMVTLINVCFEYIKILSKFFTKYIVPILQACNKKLNFNIIFHYFFKNNNILLHNDGDIRMIGKIII
jgi:hypothetical protein